MHVDVSNDGTFFETVCYLLLWYTLSFGTLFLNKYILSWLSGEPSQLGSIQMFVTTTCGGLQLCTRNFAHKAFSRGKGSVTSSLPVKLTDRKSSGSGWVVFCRNMVIVGMMRFVTVVLGLVSLKYVAVSFTETVKASAPLFTVLIAWMLIGERTELYVVLSLVPIMGGLALCSANEISFTMIGFMAALINNIVDCIQNVYSKKLLSKDENPYSPVELQFYASVAAMIMQLPFWILYMDSPLSIFKKSSYVLTVFLTNGLMFHFQSITAYSLMSLISPVTHSVANTVKRALLIWLSVLIFSNKVTALSALGTILVIAGVLLYNQAKHVGHKTAQEDTHSKYVSLTEYKI
ncbi:solute carrier family 35 member E2A-like [Corticium candelabrum]|uniref:solute carrier family 35 member E2A-like n=1 Tax=Corticium candelabrum TaxID=121492 RepID=UPI002E2674DE|nr:solute carrier family 35 member E2A-like [Corticium candelabrum]